MIDNKLSCETENCAEHLSQRSEDVLLREQVICTKFYDFEKEQEKAASQEEFCRTKRLKLVMKNKLWSSQ